MAETVLRIAHAHGNRRHRIDAAIAAGADVIEVDLRWRNDRVWVRHEHRMGWLPVLFNHRLKGIHREGPLRVILGPWYLRLDRKRILLGELLERVDNRAGLVLDFKDAVYTREGADAFVANVLAQLERSGFNRRLEFTGSWALLDIVRNARPGQMVHYSVDDAGDFEAIRPRLVREGEAIGASIRVDLLTEERAATLRKCRTDVWAWNAVSDEEAETAIERGAAGVMADDLGLLARLASRQLARAV